MQTIARAALRYSPSIVAAAMLAGTACAQTAPPKADVRPVTDIYFGQAITDPYRWMEDSKGAEMQAWMKEQADYTDAKLRAMPLREDFLRELNELDKSGPIVRGAVRRGTQYFYLKTLPGEPNAKL